MPDYHWTPANQRRFLEALSEEGLVGAAVRAAGMSREAAYSFRRRREGAAFALGEEQLEFGQVDHNRSLSDEEEQVQRAINAVELAPLRAAAEAARDAWFAVDAELRAELDLEEAIETQATALAGPSPVFAPRTLAELEKAEPPCAGTDDARAEPGEPAAPQAADQPAQPIPFSTPLPVIERPRYGLGGQIPPWAERVW